VEESVAMIELLIRFLQNATGKQHAGGKLKVIALSHGEHDSDCVLKRMFEKPNALSDFYASIDTPLQGN
jgi:hypothetical protein